MVLEGGEFRLRAFRISDAPALALHANNRKIWRNLRNLLPRPYTLGSAEAWIEQMSVSDPLRHGFVIDIDGALAGAMGYTLEDDVHTGDATIGYWLGEPYWGRGIATEAVRLLTDHAFRTHKLRRAEARVYAWNPASVRVLEKAGYVLEGRLRNAVEKDGEVTDELVYGYVRAG